MKRAQSSTVGVTIAIVLGIALVVFLIWGFSTNWAMFSSTSGAFSGKTNVDSIRNACSSQCESQFTVEYCQVEKKVIFPDGTTESITCQDTRIAPARCDILCDVGTGGLTGG